GCKTRREKKDAQNHFCHHDSLAILWAGSLVATRAHAMTIGGPCGVRLTLDVIDPINKVDWGSGSGNNYCNDGTRGEASDYRYCCPGGGAGGGGGAVMSNAGMTADGTAPAITGAVMLGDKGTDGAARWAGTTGIGKKVGAVGPEAATLA